MVKWYRCTSQSACFIFCLPWRFRKWHIWGSWYRHRLTMTRSTSSTSLTCCATTSRNEERNLSQTSEPPDWQMSDFLSRDHPPTRGIISQMRLRWCSIFKSTSTLQHPTWQSQSTFFLQRRLKKPARSKSLTRMVQKSNLDHSMQIRKPWLSLSGTSSAAIAWYFYSLDGLIEGIYSSYFCTNQARRTCWEGNQSSYHWLRRVLIHQELCRRSPSKVPYLRGANTKTP